MDIEKLNENVKLKYDMFNNIDTTLPNLPDNKLNVLMYLFAILKDKEDKAVSISIDDFLSVLRLGSKKRLSRNETNELVTDTINTFISEFLTKKVETDHIYEVSSIRLFSKASWNKDNDILTMVAADEFIPMLNALTAYFVEFPLLEYVKLRGKYLKRIYFELAKYKNLNVGKVEFDYNQLVILLQIPEARVKKGVVFTDILNQDNIKKLQVYFPELSMSVVRSNRKPKTVIFTWNARQTKARFNKAIKSNKSYARELDEKSLIKTTGALGQVLTMLEIEGTVDGLNNEVFLDHEARNEIYEYASNYWLDTPMRMSELIDKILINFQDSSFYFRKAVPEEISDTNNYQVPEKYAEAVMSAKKHTPLAYLKLLKNGGLITSSEKYFVSRMTKEVTNMNDEVVNMVMWNELVNRKKSEMHLDTVELIANRWLRADVQTAEQAVQQIEAYASERNKAIKRQKQAHERNIVEPSIAVGNNSEPTELSAQGKRDMAQLNERLKHLKTKR